MTSLKQIIDSPLVTDLISFNKAYEILKQKFPDTTNEEFAMWAWSGDFAYENKHSEWILHAINTEDEVNSRGFTCYFESSEIAWELESLIISAQTITEKHVFYHLTNSKFSRSEIEVFQPNYRWVSYENLLQRWTKITDSNQAEILIEVKTNNKDLIDEYPFNKELGNIKFAIFSLDEILFIEINELSKDIEISPTIKVDIADKHNSQYIPRNAIGKLTLKAALEIEEDKNRRATAKEVMSLLQRWADEGYEPSYLIQSDEEKKSVIWMTDKSIEKIYSLEACEKTLNRIIKNRQ